MGEDRTGGHLRPRPADLSSESGWVTTDVAARSVRVSPRTIRRYIERGELEAKPQGEGVNRSWLVSVDSLHRLRGSRTLAADPRDAGLGTEPADVGDSMADVFRDLAARLERRAEEAAELRVRLELTERAQSTTEEGRRRAEEELAAERRRREEAEREREGLQRELEALKAATGAPEAGDAGAQEAARGAGGVEAPTSPQTATSRPGEARRSWWRKLMGR